MVFRYVPHNSFRTYSKVFTQHTLEWGHRVTAFGNLRLVKDRNCSSCRNTGCSLKLGNLNYSSVLTEVDILCCDFPFLSLFCLQSHNHRERYATTPWWLSCVEFVRCAGWHEKSASGMETFHFNMTLMSLAHFYSVSVWLCYSSTYISVLYISWS